MNLPIYLDYNATTPVASEVADAMLAHLREHFGNPSSAHRYGQRAREALEQARWRVSARGRRVRPCERASTVKMLGPGDRSFLLPPARLRKQVQFAQWASPGSSHRWAAT